MQCSYLLLYYCASVVLPREAVLMQRHGAKVQLSTEQGR